jgi:hypothetical protein
MLLLSFQDKGRNQKAEVRKDERVWWPFSAFGLRPSFGFRPSDFGFQGRDLTPNPDFPSIWPCQPGPRCYGSIATGTIAAIFNPSNLVGIPLKLCRF